MNSLEDLNNYSQTEIEYTDQRPADVLFDNETATGQAITVETGSTHTTPVGIQIVEIINYEQSLPTYEIDLQGTTGATAAWVGLPAYLTVNSSTPGLYIVSGMKSVSDWNLIKAPTITTPAGFEGYWTYSATVKWNALTTLETMPWSVAVYSGSVSDLSSPQIFYYTSSSTQTITGNPILTTTTSPATFTVTITPNTLTALTNIITSGTGGTTSTNGSTKVVTITGTRTQVNSHLNSIAITTNSSISDFNLTFYVTNNFNANTDTVIMNIVNVSVQFLTNPSSVTYNEDLDFYNRFAPTITDASFSDSTGYTLTITPSSTSAITLMNTFGNLGGTETFNATTKVLTLTGTRAQINQHLTSLTGSTVIGYAITPGDNFDQNFFLTYSVTTPRGTVATKIQNLLIGVTDTDAGNLGITRTYLANQGNTIFASTTPFIGDVTPGAGYTIFLTCSFGRFALDANSVPTTTFSVSGSKTFINSKIAGIVFYPNPGVSSNGIFTWAQYKNNVLSFSQDISITGTAQAFAGTRTLTFNATQTWTPTAADVLYGKIANLLVAGGGGGGAHGGGGGGQVQQATNIALTQQTYTITVGGGGAASANWGFPGTGGNAGGSSSAFGYTALGGTGGGKPLNPLNNETPSDGGNTGTSEGGDGVKFKSAEENVPFGTYRSAEWIFAGGGGAASSGNGFNGAVVSNGTSEVIGSFTSYTPESITAGLGRNGITATFFGGVYGSGGGGGGSSGGASAGGAAGGTNAGNGATPFGSVNNATPAVANFGGGGGGGTIIGISTNINPSTGQQLTPGGGTTSFYVPSAGASGVVKIRIEGA